MHVCVYESLPPLTNVSHWVPESGFNDLSLCFNCLYYFHQSTKLLHGLHVVCGAHVWCVVCGVVCVWCGVVCVVNGVNACGCVVWMCGVDVWCGCVVWMCGVDVWCGCVVWMCVRTCLCLGISIALTNFEELQLLLLYTRSKHPESKHPAIHPATDITNEPLVVVLCVRYNHCLPSPPLMLPGFH